MSMRNDSNKKNLKKNEVLVIEDQSDDMKCVKRSLPDNCVILTDDPRFCKLCEKGIDGGRLQIKQDDGTKNSVNLKDYLKKILTEHHSTLRAIVCDLKLGTDKEGGVKVIKWIRDVLHNGVQLHNNYLKFIPIIVYTSSTNSGEAERADALEAGANAFIMKNHKEISNGYGVEEQLRDVLKNDIDYFQYLYSHLQLDSKCYKVALSFTGGSKITRHREFVEEIAHHLYGHYTKGKVFYDIDKAKDGSTISLTKDDFTEIYGEKCEFVIVCVSEDYNTEDNPWTQKEWEGIHKLYEKSRFHVIFVSLEKGLTSDIFKEHLSIANEPIWIDASKSVEDFYEILSGQNKDQKSVLNNILNSNALLKEYPLASYKLYRDYCHKIATDIVKPIVGRIEETEKDENDFVR